MSRNQRIVVVLGALIVGVAFAVASPGVLQMIFERVAPLTKDPVTGEAIRVTYFGAYNPANIIGCGLLGLIVGGALSRLLIRTSISWFDKWDQLHRGDKINVILSIFAGLFASIPLLLFLNSLQQNAYLPFAFFAFSIGLAMASYFTLRIMADTLPWNRDRGPAKRTGVKILDTNVLIDGRIYDVARTGFFEGPIYVPRFVLEELQYIADSHDSLRRQRGRRGLDILRLIQSEFPTEVGIHDRLIQDPSSEVDSRLVQLARAMGADIVTNDFNLNRVASMQQVKVLNLNDLALAMRPNVLPSEILQIPIVREGNQFGQGIGYLEDGTMVVVENGKAHMGETMEVVVTQVIQTERGKMIFAEVDPEDSSQTADQRQKQRPRRQY